VGLDRATGFAFATAWRAAAVETAIKVLRTNPARNSRIPWSLRLFRAVPSSFGGSKAEATKFRHNGFCGASVFVRGRADEQLRAIAFARRWQR
jgi:hypothetical protein